MPKPTAGPRGSGRWCRSRRGGSRTAGIARPRGCGAGRGRSRGRSHPPRGDGGIAGKGLRPLEKCRARIAKEESNQESLRKYSQKTILNVFPSSSQNKRPRRERGPMVAAEKPDRSSFFSFRPGASGRAGPFFRPGRSILRGGSFRGGRLDRIFRDDVEGEIDRNVRMEPDLDGVLAEGLHRGVKVDALLLNGEAGGGKLVVEIVDGDGTEHHAALARFHRKRQRSLFQVFRQLLRARQFVGLPRGPALLESVNLAAVRTGDGNGKFLRKQKIPGVAGTDLDLVALAAEAVDRPKKKNFVVGHGNGKLRIRCASRRHGSGARNLRSPTHSHRQGGVSMPDSFRKRGRGGKPLLSRRMQDSCTPLCFKATYWR